MMLPVTTPFHYCVDLSTNQTIPFAFSVCPIIQGGRPANYVCVQNASGDILVKVDHDDELCPGILEIIAKNWAQKCSKVKDLGGVLYKSIRTDNNEETSVPPSNLQDGLAAFSFEERRRKRVKKVDGLLVLTRAAYTEISRYEDTLQITQNGLNLLRIDRKYSFFFEEHIGLIYHKDVMLSQTNTQRVTFNLMYTYCKYLELCDWEDILHPARFVRLIAALGKYSHIVLGKPFAAVTYIDNLPKKMLFAFLSWLSVFKKDFRGTRHEYYMYDKSELHDLPELEALDDVSNRI